MASQTPRLLTLQRAPSGIRLSWKGDLEVELSARQLRLECPCAKCVSEVTGQRILNPASVPEDVAILEMTPLGNYAYRIGFSDEHDTGLYTLDMLYARCVSVGGSGS